MMSCTLFAVIALTTIPGIRSDMVRGGVAPRCESRACNPRMGNLVLGRRVLTQTVCGYNSTELHCSYPDPPANGPCAPAKCTKCNAALPLQAHLAAAMADSSFRHPNTWWQSAEGAESETVQLDLEVEFYFTHLIVVFRSPRPAAMTLERSQDFGRTWRVLQFYARDCNATFGWEEGTAGPDGALCTSKYSGAYPCSRGEVIYRALPQWESLDPFGAEAQEQLRVTNIRMNLLQHQSCPCQAKDPAYLENAPPTKHFAIYDLIVKGSCFCNGHAEQCVPAPGYRPIRDRTNHVMCHLGLDEKEATQAWRKTQRSQTAPQPRVLKSTQTIHPHPRANREREEGGGEVERDRGEKEKNESLPETTLTCHVFEDRLADNVNSQGPFL